jgi:hypothetical protein
MGFDLSAVQYSRHDLRRGIRIPTELTEDLAEFLGIVVGDGHVGTYTLTKEKYHHVHYEALIAGNLKEKEYYTTYVNGLIERVFGIRFNHRPMEYTNVFALRYCSKALFLFLSRVIGIPQRKDSITIPDCVMNSHNKIKAAFFRGLADADFCLTIKYKPRPYPVLQGAFKSQKLVENCSHLLKELGIENCTLREESYYEKRNKTYVLFRVNINGKPRIRKYLQLIGFSNPYKLLKYAEHFKIESGPGGI